MNQAAELGPAAKPWWRDWRGECVAIIASGPSTKHANIPALRERINVLAIKQNVDLCPWADVVYGCDAAWWIHRRGLPGFKGVKLSYAPVPFKDIRQIEIDRSRDAILTEKPGCVGTGGNSGFQALNIAVQFGATGICLIGYDCRQDGNSPHWYGRNEWQGSANPIEDNYKRWRNGFAASAQSLLDLGVDVVNASNKSKLDCFRKASVEDTLKGWGL